MGGEVDLSGDLVLGHSLAGIGEDLVLQSLGGLIAVGQFDHRADFLAILVVGHAHGAGIGHRRVLDELVIDFLRVDVDAADDDRLGAAAGEEQVAVLVEKTDITHGEIAVPAAGVGLGAVLEVLEPALVGQPHVDRAGLAWGQLVSGLVEDLRRLGIGALAHRAWLLQPVLGRHPEPNAAL